MSEDPIERLNQEMEDKFGDIGALHIFPYLKDQEKDRVRELIAAFDGDKEHLEKLVKQYNAARKAHKEADSGTWESLIALYEDSNTSVSKVTNKIADFLLKKHHFKTPRDQRRIWRFKNPVYQDDGIQTIQELLYENLGGYIKTHHVNEIKNEIESRTYVDREEEKPPAKYIPVKNGWYNQETGQLEEPNPEYFAINEVPIEYDPDADCPRFKQFVKELVNEEDVKIIQEMFGYCLHREYPLARAFMLLGNGANGKSTLLEILEELIGHNNVATPSLQKLGRRDFASSELYGKLANIHADLSSQPIQDSGTFKMLTGGDLINAERKHEHAFQFKNYAKLIYSANELPATSDDTNAFFRRWIVIKFPYQFTSNPDDGFKDKDANIKNKICTDEELSGIFNWAIEGLNRVLENEEFSNTESRKEIKREWLLRTQPMQIYFDECLELEAGSHVKKNQLYNHYVDFCEMIGTVSKGRSVFFKELYSAIPQCEEVRIGGRGNREQVIQGIVTKELETRVKDVKGKSKLSRVRAPARMQGEVPDTLDTFDTEELFKKVRSLAGDTTASVGEIIDAFPDVEEDRIVEMLNELQKEGRLFEPREPGELKPL